MLAAVSHSAYKHYMKRAMKRTVNVASLLGHLSKAIFHSQLSKLNTYFTTYATNEIQAKIFVFKTW